MRSSLLPYTDWLHLHFSFRQGSTYRMSSTSFDKHCWITRRRTFHSATWRNFFAAEIQTRAGLLHIVAIVRSRDLDIKRWSDEGLVKTKPFYQHRFFEALHQWGLKSIFILPAEKRAYVVGASAHESIRSEWQVKSDDNSSTITVISHRIVPHVTTVIVSIQVIEDLPVSVIF